MRRVNRTELRAWLSDPVTEQLHYAMKDRIEDGRTQLEVNSKEISQDYIRGMIRAYREMLEFEPEFEVTGEENNATDGI